MGYTMDDYKDYEKLADEERKGYATKPALVEKIEYPMTVQGQYDFMEDFLNRISHIDDGKGKGFFYWEPAWIPVPGSGWATPASLNTYRIRDRAATSGQTRHCLIMRAMRCRR